VRRRNLVQGLLSLAGILSISIGSVPGTASATPARSPQAPQSMSYFQHQIAQYTAMPKFTAPGPAFNAVKAVKGKALLTIPSSSSIPFVQTIANNMGATAKKVGLKYTIWPNQGQPSQWTQGMQAAINRKFNSIDILAGINPAVLQPQIVAAKRAGISTVVSHLYDLNQPAAPNVDVVDIPYRQAGRLLADWTILKTHASVDAVVVTINEVLSTGPMVAGINDEMKKCGSGCKLSSVNVSIPEIATRIQPQVQSALARDPKINYVIALYDSAEAPFAAAGIKAAGKQNRVKVVTFNGTPSVLKMVQQHDVVEMDIGENLNWIALGIMDQHMRLMGGLKPVKNERIPLRVFSSSNVNQTGTPPQDSTGYGSKYVKSYYKLWHVK